MVAGNILGILSETHEAFTQWTALARTKQPQTRISMAWQGASYGELAGKLTDFSPILSRAYAFPHMPLILQSPTEIRFGNIAVGKDGIVGANNIRARFSAKIVPAVNQTELHPFLPQDSLHDFFQSKGKQLLDLLEEVVQPSTRKRWSMRLQREEISPWRMFF